jgi:hypothetical protein
MLEHQLERYAYRLGLISVSFYPLTKIFPLLLMDVYADPLDQLEPIITYGNILSFEFPLQGRREVKTTDTLH